QEYRLHRQASPGTGTVGRGARRAAIVGRRGPQRSDGPRPTVCGQAPPASGRQLSPAPRGGSSRGGRRRMVAAMGDGVGGVRLGGMRGRAARGGVERVDRTRGLAGASRRVARRTPCIYLIGLPLVRPPVRVPGRGGGSGGS